MTFVKRIDYLFDFYIGPFLYTNQKSYYEYLKQKWGNDYGDG
jgi:hypothetical protein